MGGLDVHPRPSVQQSIICSLTVDIELPGITHPQSNDDKGKPESDCKTIRLNQL